MSVPNEFPPSGRRSPAELRPGNPCLPMDPRGWRCDVCYDKLDHPLTTPLPEILQASIGVHGLQMNIVAPQATEVAQHLVGVLVM